MGDTDKSGTLSGQEIDDSFFAIKSFQHTHNATGSTRSLQRKASFSNLVTRNEDAKVAHKMHKRIQALIEKFTGVFSSRATMMWAKAADNQILARQNEFCKYFMCALWLSDTVAPEADDVSLYSFKLEAVFLRQLFRDSPWLLVWLMQCSKKSHGQFRELFSEWMHWRQVVGNTWEGQVDVISSPSIAQIGHWLMFKADRHKRNMLGELVTMLSHASLPNEKSSVHKFHVGQRIYHKAKSETGTIVSINVGNLRKKQFEVQFDSGETHQYTEDALNDKFTFEDVDEGYQAITSPRKQIHEHIQVVRDNRGPGVVSWVKDTHDEKWCRIRFASNGDVHDYGDESLIAKVKFKPSNNTLPEAIAGNSSPIIRPRDVQPAATTPDAGLAELLAMKEQCAELQRRLDQERAEHEKIVADLMCKLNEQQTKSSSGTTTGNS